MAAASLPGVRSSRVLHIRNMLELASEVSVAGFHFAPLYRQLLRYLPCMCVSVIRGWGA
jgi:hypothetical protein